MERFDRKQVAFGVLTVLCALQVGLLIRRSIRRRRERGGGATPSSAQQRKPLEFSSDDDSSRAAVMELSLPSDLTTNIANDICIENAVKCRPPTPPLLLFYSPLAPCTIYPEGWRTPFSLESHCTCNQVCRTDFMCL